MSSNPTHHSFPISGITFFPFSNFPLRSQMEVLRHQTPPPPSSTLNPYAPAFIPMAYYDVVEDFSDQWWSLVHSSPCFRDYWLRECFQDLQSDPLFPEEDDLLLIDSVFGDCLGNQEEQEKSRSDKELIAASALRWNNSKAHGRGDAPRYGEKAPKVVNVKLSPRPIQQPR
ncbi:hypothetical protein V2J09_003461 [Rumex salicifolius]